jgi:tetratricopeptide (TPR) repeat protein
MEKRMKKTRLLIPLIVLFLMGDLFVMNAQEQEPRPFWYTLERGKQYFRGGDYGDALIAFEDARDQRREMYTRMEQSLIDLLSIPEVRRLGNSLTQVETYISERHQLNAQAALAELYYRVPRDSFQDSALAALNTIGGFKDFPDAEYWIGETYRVEGEYGIALRQYQKAYDQRELLQNPGFEVEILYKMADVHRTLREYNEMEANLTDILIRDSLWSDTANANTRAAMMRTLTNNGVNRFLTLYRYNNQPMERAHRELGLYYLASGRHNRAVEHLIFSFLIQTTIVIEEIIRHQYDFTFSALEPMINETQRNNQLLDYIEEVEYYKTIFYLGSSLYGSGSLPAARELWTFLSRGSMVTGEWRAKATDQLERPSLEAVIEMP